MRKANADAAWAMLETLERSRVVLSEAKRAERWARVTLEQWIAAHGCPACEGSGRVEEINPDDTRQVVPCVFGCPVPPRSGVNETLHF